MRNEHERYEKLAVGHVLGGLDVGESADFRSHLLGCRDCRLRVAELRDLAADLDAAERDERARALVRTEVVRRDEDEHDAPTSRFARIGVRHVAVAAAVVIVLAAAMAFWNLHLRTAVAGYAQAATYRGDTLRELSAGVPVAVEAADGVTALVTVGDDEVAFTVSRLPPLAQGQRLEVWLLSNGAAERAVEPVPARNVTEGAVAGHVPRGDADVLVITRERGELTDAPGGDELLRAELAATP